MRLALERILRRLFRFNNNLISIISLMVGLYILLVLATCNELCGKWTYYTTGLPDWMIIIFAIGLIAIVAYLSRKKIIIPGSISYKKLLLVNLILLALQLIIVWSIYLQLQWDVFCLKYAAGEFLSQNLSEYVNNYFATNSNNMGMLAITCLFIKVGNTLGIPGYGALVGFGVLLNNLSVLMLALTVQRLHHNKAITWSMYILATLLFGLSPWMVAAYTDIFSVFIPVCTLYFYILAKQDYFKTWFAIVLVVLPPALGYIIKPTNLFIFLAIGFVELLYCVEDIRFRWSGFFLMLIALALAVTTISVGRNALYSTMDYSPDIKAEKPMTHYLLLGSNYDDCGMYNKEDDDYTNSFVGTDEKQRADLELVAERYSDMGRYKTIKHLYHKTYMNYGLGTFGWGKEIDFVKSIPEKNYLIQRFFCNIYYLNKQGVTKSGQSFGCYGKYFQGYAFFAQLIWMIALMLCVFGNLNIHTKNTRCHIHDYIRRLLSILFVGLFVFLSLFETNARYLYSYLPVFVVLSSYGLRNLISIINKEV